MTVCSRIPITRISFSVTIEDKYGKGTLLRKGLENICRCRQPVSETRRRRGKEWSDSLRAEEGRIRNLLSPEKFKMEWFYGIPERDINFTGLESGKIYHVLVIEQ